MNPVNHVNPVYLFLTLFALACVVVPASANDAEIVLLIGKGDSRETAAAQWRPAAVKQKLVAGSFVRTGEMSQMGLLLRDRTQLRLNQLSILNIKSVAATAPPPATQLELPQGRVWSQTKPKPGQVAERKPATLEVSMPAATAVIRGTDWELVAEKDGTSTVTVLSGEIEFFNEHGRVAVLPNEQARAVPGKAPVKILLTNAAERVQWVTAYRPQPRRWVKDTSGGLDEVVKRIEEGEYAPAMQTLNRLMKDQPQTRARAALLLADLHLSQGQAADAISLLDPDARGGQGDAMAAALLVRANLIAGRIANAASVMEAAAPRNRDHVELLLARAELARVQGNEPEMRRALLDVIRVEPGNPEAWYGIGRIETEREYVAAARDALNRAIKIQPDGPGYQGELATLETFANDFAAADRAFRDALARQPDDYVALTGLGVLQLKRGETEAALESFLKAGVIEPRYSRAWFFSGAAYYQLGERARAAEAFEKAASLDDKDPLPYLMRSLVHFDALELGKAIEASREAQARMGYVKSLNQVLTDQKGSANVGTALAAFGMEEWSRAYAYDSYSPYWAGSHLFLSDRFEGTYNRNSELFKGLLTDPSVFGASNRYSSIVPVPGTYGSVSAAGSRDYITEYGVGASVNGYSTTWKPFSYFIGGDVTDGDSVINRTDADGRMSARGGSAVLGLGLRPAHEIGIFAFANYTYYDGKISDRASGLTDDNYSYDYRRADIGLNYKFSPTSQAWFKVGTGSEVTPVSGLLFSQATADSLNTAFGTTIFQPAGRLNNFRSDLSQNDAQWRHTFDVNPAVQLSWGVEYAESDRPFVLAVEFQPIRINLNQENRIESGTAYLSGRFKLTDSLDGQLDLHYQDTTTSFVTDQTVQIGAGPPIQIPREAGETHYRELNPRLGVKWRPLEGQTVRLAGQLWRKPAAVSTLGPVDTVGIPLDDRIERDGGRLKRVRLQHEIQFGRAAFFQWFADWKEIKNLDDAGAGIVPDLELEQLERLRNRKRVYGARQDYLEDTPDFGRGRIAQAGLSMNRLLSRNYTVAARYVFASTENTTADFGGRDVPFHPRHYLNTALNWQPYARWVVGPTATYRSSRYADEANTALLAAGWSFGLNAYWESEDKRWSVAGVLDQLHSDKQSSIYRYPVVQVQTTLRF
jgi:tetratricopeptide (TPR) repeat protein